MRRKDREVTDLQEIAKIIDKCEVIRLGLADGNVPYIVPLNFGYEVVDDRVAFVFHSALEGRKIDMMKKNPNVCFELDCSLTILKGAVACNWGAEFESVVGYGEIKFIENDDEKKTALNLLMARYGFEGPPEYMQSALAKTAVYKLYVSEVTGKRRML